MKQFCIFCLLHGSHATRHAEGRGYGRENRDGGLNDEAPYLSFLFIHDFSCWFKGSIMRTFFSSFGFVALRFAGLSPQAEGSQSKVCNPRVAGRKRERARWQGAFQSCGEVPLLGAVGGWPVGSPWGFALPSYAGRVAGSAVSERGREACRPAPWVNRPGCRCPRRYPGLRRQWWPS